MVCASAVSECRQCVDGGDASVLSGAADLVGLFYGALGHGDSDVGDWERCLSSWAVSDAIVDSAMGKLCSKKFSMLGSTCANHIKQGGVWGCRSSPPFSQRRGALRCMCNHQPEDPLSSLFISFMMLSLSIMEANVIECFPGKICPAIDHFPAYIHPPTIVSFNYSVEPNFATVPDTVAKQVDVLLREIMQKVPFIHIEYPASSSLTAARHAP
jgi:hypothetical protein